MFPRETVKHVLTTKRQGSPAPSQPANRAAASSGDDGATVLFVVPAPPELGADAAHTLLRILRAAGVARDAADGPDDVAYPASA